MYANRGIDDPDLYLINSPDDVKFFIIFIYLFLDKNFVKEIQL